MLLGRVALHKRESGHQSACLAPPHTCNVAAAAAAAAAAKLLYQLLAVAHLQRGPQRSPQCTDECRPGSCKGSGSCYGSTMQALAPSAQGQGCVLLWACGWRCLISMAATARLLPCSCHFVVMLLHMASYTAVAQAARGNSVAGKLGALMLGEGETLG